MKLFRRQNDTQVVNNEQLADSYAVPQGRRVDWKRAVPRMLALILLLVLLVWGVAWAIGNSNDDKQAKKAENPNKIAQSTDRKSEKKETSKKKPVSGSSDRAAGSSTPGKANPAPAPSTPAPTAQTNQQLTNSGPGEVAGIFAVTTAAGAIVYQVKLRRKLSLS